MELMEAILTRRSVRAYTDEPVTDEQIDALLNAAVHAPSGMNTQPWAFGVLTGKESLRALSQRAKEHLLAGLTDDSPLARYREHLEDPEANLFYDAPALVLIYTKPAVTAQIDGCLAAENLMLAAHGMGLGTCWIGLAMGLLMSKPVCEEFGVPADHSLAAVLIVGHPAAVPDPVDHNPPEVLFRR